METVLVDSCIFIDIFRGSKDKNMKRKKVRRTIEERELSATGPAMPENVKGILTKYQSPALIDNEKPAWETAVMEKHLQFLLNES